MLFEDHWSFFGLRDLVSSFNINVISIIYLFFPYKSHTRYILRFGGMLSLVSLWVTTGLVGVRFTISLPNSKHIC